MSAVVEQSGRPAERRMPWRGMLGSLLLHLAIIALLLGLWQTAPAPELVVPHVTVVIEAPGSEGSSGGGGGAGPGQGEAPAASAQGSTIAQAEAAPPTVEQTPPSETPATAIAQETTPAAPAPEITVPPTPAVPLPTPEKVLATAPPPPPKPQRKPPLPQPPSRIATTAPPLPQAAPPLPEPAPAPAATPAPAQTLASAAPAAEGPDTGGPGGASGAGRGAEGKGLGSAGNGSGPGDDYLDRVRRRLRQFQKYPDEAVKQKQEGTVVLAITVARDGSVLDATVARSSGFPLIDEAAVKMARDATPLPPFPPTYTQDQRTFDVPQKYEIGLFDRIFR